MAGISAARVLSRAGIAVTLFDKGRRVGGRLATRHVDGFTFNHGCQFFTARDARFADAVRPFSAPWPAAGDGRFAGVPDMAAIAAGLAAGLDVRQGARVRRLERSAEGWRLHFDDGVAGPFGAVILAIPAPQAADLLNGISHHFAARLAAVRMAPCWAVMLGFAAPAARTALEIQMNVPAWPDGIWASWRGGGETRVSWAARENTRPDAPNGPPAFTFHAAAAWSARHIEDKPEDVIDAVLSEGWAFGGHKPVYAAAHRWRYALAEQSLGEDFLWDEQAALGLCGDWCLAGRLEAAYLSGRALGIRLAA
jgi:predicted NAD/FAD-dependent oxidoreductase